MYDYYLLNKLPSRTTHVNKQLTYVFYFTNINTLVQKIKSKLFAFRIAICLVIKTP